MPSPYNKIPHPPAYRKPADPHTPRTPASSAAAEYPGAPASQGAAALSTEAVTVSVAVAVAVADTKAAASLAQSTMSAKITPQNDFDLFDLLANGNDQTVQSLLFASDEATEWLKIETKIYFLCTNDNDQELLAVVLSNTIVANWFFKESEETPCEKMKCWMRDILPNHIGKQEAKRIETNFLSALRLKMEQEHLINHVSSSFSPEIKTAPEPVATPAPGAATTSPPAPAAEPDPEPVAAPAEAPETPDIDERPKTLADFVFDTCHATLSDQTINSYVISQVIKEIANYITQEGLTVSKSIPVVFATYLAFVNTLQEESRIEWLQALPDRNTLETSLLAAQAILNLQNQFHETWQKNLAEFVFDTCRITLSDQKIRPSVISDNTKIISDKIFQVNKEIANYIKSQDGLTISDSIPVVLTTYQAFVTTLQEGPKTTLLQKALPDKKTLETSLKTSLLAAQAILDTQNQFHEPWQKTLVDFVFERCRVTLSDQKIKPSISQFIKEIDNYIKSQDALTISDSTPVVFATYHAFVNTLQEGQKIKLLQNALPDIKTLGTSLSDHRKKDLKRQQRIHKANPPATPPVASPGAATGSGSASSAAGTFPLTSSEAPFTRKPKPQTPKKVTIESLFIQFSINKTKIPQSEKEEAVGNLLSTMETQLQTLFNQARSPEQLNELGMQCLSHLDLLENEKFEEKTIDILIKKATKIAGDKTPLDPLLKEAQKLKTDYQNRSLFLTLFQDSSPSN